jgi:hypothetical protein
MRRWSSRSNTPHNFGQPVLNRIAELLGVSWTRTGDAFPLRTIYSGTWKMQRNIIARWLGL